MRREEEAGREEGSVTQFTASPDAQPLGPATPCPASGLGQGWPPLHLSPGSCLPQPGHAPQAPPRSSPLRCTAVPTAPPPPHLRRNDVTSPPHSSASVSARTQVGALSKGENCAGWRKGEEQRGSGEMCIVLGNEETELIDSSPNNWEG